MISGTSTDYACVQHVGSLNQYKSAATSTEWAHVIAEHSMNPWHSFTAFFKIFLYLKGVKSQKTETFLMWVVWIVMCAYNKLRLHFPDRCKRLQRITQKRDFLFLVDTVTARAIRVYNASKAHFPRETLFMNSKEYSMAGCSWEPLVAQLFLTYLE